MSTDAKQASERPQADVVALKGVKPLPTQSQALPDERPSPKDDASAQLAPRNGEEAKAPLQDGEDAAEKPTEDNAGNTGDQGHESFLRRHRGLFLIASPIALLLLYGDVTLSYFAWSRIYVGIGLPLILIPVLTASYAGVPPGKTDQASALINAARNIGGSIGISLSTNVLAHRSQFHQSRLVENVSPSDPEYQDTLRKVTEYFTMQGNSHEHAHRQAIEWIGQQVQLQASFLAYIDVFWTLMLLGLAVVPLALALRNIKLGKASASAE